jgi:BirA family biotin operon repressor/biotin-[acetyl-CoA-carboxylase] ligase
VRWHVVRFAELDSTNRWVLDEARGGAADGLVCVADHQTAGRGRRGRVWNAPPGSSLLVSVLLRPGLDAGRVHIVTMAAGLALAEAVDEVAGIRALLKWPNDLIVDGRKLAGLLAEADLSATGDAHAVVVGVGCNVDWQDFPPELAETATACNLEAGHSVDRSALLDAFLAHFAQRLDHLDDVPADYRARLDTLGRRVQVDLGQRVIEGVAVEIDASGQLLVTRDDGEPETIAVGDVVHVRPA